MVLWTALAASILCVRPALGATYTTDTSYQFTGQTLTNSGAGIAVNSTNTRLYVIKKSSTAGAILSLDTATGNQVGSVTPTGNTTIYDVALSPDNTTLYFVRLAADLDSYEIAAAPASDGNHTAAEVTTAIPGLFDRPTSIAVVQSGSDVYMGIVTSPDFYIYKRSGGGAWTLHKTVDIGFSSAVRDVAALDTGTGIVFYILRPGVTPNIQAYNLDGTPRSVSFAPLPAAFEGYAFDSITAVPSVDGEPALYLAADFVDGSFNLHLSLFRYTPTGAFTGEGFGYKFGATTLTGLAPWDTDPLVVPTAVTGNHLYIGGALPGRFGGGPQTVRVVIGQDTTDPGRIAGTVLQATETGPVPAAAATVVIAGRSTPTAVTGADGLYAFTPLIANTYTLGAWKYGYVAASQSVTLASGENRTGVDLTLPDTVPTFTIAPAFQPPILDGWTFNGEYPTPPMPFFLPGGAAPEEALRTTAYVTHDAENLYVSVFGNEPGLALNSAQSTNVNMLTLDDTIQIYVDPPHRHDAQAEVSRLYQFAVNIPPAVDGTPIGSSYRFQRRITSTGQNAGTVDASSWTSRVGYTDNGFVVETRIALTAFGLTQPPGPDDVWGLLVARNRPTTHNDNRPTHSSTSPRQPVSFTTPNTWTDVKFNLASTSVKGDVNQNGVLDVTDAIYVLRMAGGLSFAGPGFLGENTAYWQAILQAADVAPAGAPDGAITLLDAVRLMRAANGQETLP